jgi:hypothetical protein
MDNRVLRGSVTLGFIPETMTKKRAKKKTFSTVKAVKANARDRVGQPRPERVIEDAPREQKRKSKHKTTLHKLLNTDD